MWLENKKSIAGVVHVGWERAWVAEGLRDPGSAPVPHLDRAQVLGRWGGFLPGRLPVGATRMLGYPCIRGRKDLLNLFLQLVQVSG